MRRLLRDARLLQLLPAVLVFLRTFFQEVTLERTTTTTRAMTMMKTPSSEGFPKEEEEAEVEEKAAEVETKVEEKRKNRTVLEEVVGAEEEGAKAELEGAVPSLELSCLAGPSPALRLDLLER